MATLVSFHAHPDDEALLTGGTLALAARAGHRVVLVVATAGEAGLAAPESPDGPAGAASLGERRRDELARSARVLGVARVEVLGYPDSGWGSSTRSEAERTARPGFADLDPAAPGGPADRLAALLREEDAQVLTSYDPHGGYGHPDHVQVHRVARLAAERAGTPVLLEATLDAGPFRAAARVVAALRGAPLLGVPARRLLPDVGPLERVFLTRGELTHRVDVRTVWAQKRAALRVHASQGGTGRTVGWVASLPGPVAGVVWRHEWFRRPGQPGGGPWESPLEVLAGLDHAREAAQCAQERPPSGRQGKCDPPTERAARPK